MEQASEVLLALQPVTFHYKQELDPDGIPQFGLVAEEVANIAPDLVARDDDGKPYTVRYEAVNAMLLGEFLKTHRKVEEHGRTIVSQAAKRQQLKTGLARQEKEVQRLARAVREQMAQVENGGNEPEAIQSR